MTAGIPVSGTPLEGSAEFATTRWSVVAAAAAGGDEQERQRALTLLCESYWFPIYAFARRRHADPGEALDRVQGFFTQLLEKDGFAHADASRGRFRSYLLGGFKHFEANQREREAAQKRGGGRQVLSLDGNEAERRLRDEVLAADTPERAFERAWAHTLLAQVLARLGREYEESGRGPMFARLEPTLSGGEGPGYAALAAELGTSEGAVKVAAHRLRKRFGELLRLEIAQTLSDPGDLEDELSGLFEALASGTGSPGESA